MGQRTQMVVEVIKTDHDYKTDTDSTSRYLGSYHNQWGIGKMQLWDVMRFLTTYQSGLEDYELPKRLHKAYLMNDDYVFEGEATPENVMNWFETQDNNDGGILLKVQMDRYGDIVSGELYIFNDPEMDSCKHRDEDCDFEVNRYISLWDYLQYMPEYFNEEFLTAFTALLRFFNIKIMEPKDKEDENE